ncbi:IS66 Orf2 like protein [Legionella massiliensis]|uniref:IS66 Orf2 like protein n=1 Tax=Legionella massiliensis TaxID=1034943 RepID=A0A078L3P7_9GAMM|nr:IS66 family insertion sequence element accessory protein TnpB [Legionella massiliensis]CDZ78744.1 IS66 Orf2 like protein [Legionella massiliensis]CEE14482.1 IS66 Orf2 like protein [Legionella massiliensis]
MLQITPQHRLLLAVEPVDFRKGIDTLKELCRQKLLDDPFSGTVFVFTNRNRTAVKLLVYDANGFWLCLKRFSRGKLSWWPTGETPSVQLRSSELVILLAQGHPIKANLPEDWRCVA